MTKRRTKKDIDELSEEVLSDLTPDKRFQLLVKAQAQEKQVWIDRLIETCPRYNYQALDQAVAVRYRLSQLVAYWAIYDLHTTYLHYELVRTEQSYSMFLDYKRDEEPSDEELERAADRADELRELFSELYTAYHTYRQFVTEVLGVAPETWLALHFEGPAVFEIVAEALDNPMEIRLAESHLNEMLQEHDETTEPSEIEQDDDQEITLEDIAEVRYNKLTAVWEDAIAEIP